MTDVAKILDRIIDLSVVKVLVGPAGVYFHFAHQPSSETLEILCCGKLVLCTDTDHEVAIKGSDMIWPEVCRRLLDYGPVVYFECDARLSAFVLGFDSGLKAVFQTVKTAKDEPSIFLNFWTDSPDSSEEIASVRI